jgi:hypothetical protein
MKINASPYLHFVIFLLIGGVSGYVLSRTDNLQHQVLITLESSTPVETQLFYDTGKGFNENDSIRKVIYQANALVTLHFDFSGRNLYGLRFDPSGSAAKIKIHEIILKYQGERPFTVSLDYLTAAKDIKSLHYDGRTATVETAEAAQDPILYLSRIGPVPRLTLYKIIARILTGAAIALGIAFFIVWVYRNCLNGKETVCHT